MASNHKMEETTTTPKLPLPAGSSSKKSANAFPSKFFGEGPPTNTPSPVMRRFSSSDMMLPSAVSPRPTSTNAISPVIFMNRNSDFTRTVYEIDNGLLKQIRSSVKKPEAPPLQPVSESGSPTSASESASPSPPPIAAGEPTMEQQQRRNVPQPDFVAISPIPKKIDLNDNVPKSVPMNMTSSSNSVKAILSGEVVTDETTTKKKKKESTKPAASSSQGGHLMIKLGILLSRSSGRDKFCALMQYGSMFWGNQPVFQVSHARDATWRNLEESMSAGRKTLRLFKWIKEFERMQRAFHMPDPGPHETELRTQIASVLGFLMHTFSFAYYFIDNVLYSSQIGLINRPDVTGIFEFRKMLKSGLAHDEYMKLQRKFRADELLREESKKFEGRLKDWKNYSSLLRLVFAIVYCSLQIDSVQRAERVVEKERDASEKEKRKQLWELGELKDESGKEIIASVCNLIILLNRLQMGPFKRVPLWGVGVLGMIAAVFGLDKNWPREKPMF